MNRENYINSLQCENKDRLLFLLLLNDLGKKGECIFTTALFDPIDCIYTSKKGNKVVFELKGRSDKYQHYSTYFFEKNKYNGMIQRMNELGVRYGIYVYLFSNRIYMFNIKKIVNSTLCKLLLMPRNNVSSDKVYKDVYVFNKNIAFAEFIKKNGKWEMI